MTSEHYSGGLPVFQVAKEKGVNCGGAEKGCLEQAFLGPCKRRAVQPWVHRKGPEVPVEGRRLQTHPSTQH